jgi:beta-aspartyl-peptidase (threonine type)
MIVLGSGTAEAGMEAAVQVLRSGGCALDAVEAGIRLVEIAPEVHSVGLDAWPNLLGESELDASIMDGRTLGAGAVGALQGYRHPITVARRVMEELPHVMLVGEGAARFAREVFACQDDAERAGSDQEERSVGVREGWARWLRERMSPDEWAHWPAEELASWARLTADPETAHGTVCLLARDAQGDIASGVSTSGWAWKYPGRLGDSPIIGAGNYADNRYGAAACTGFGEMAIRASTARCTLLYRKMGLSLEEAVGAAAADLNEATWFYKGRVTIYAFDRQEHHCVVTYSRVEGSASYWIWQEGMDAADKREGIVLTRTDFSSDL